MKRVLGLLLTISVLVAFVPMDFNKILWSKDYSLQWKDFKGPVKQDEGFDAMTAYSIESGKEKNKFGIFCYFEKNKSWHIKKKVTDSLLKHEQYHFNLAEVYARKIRKQITEEKLLKNSKLLEKAFKDNLRTLEKVQKIYDKETNHSKISTEQAKWEKDIDKQLQELNDFSNPLVE
ncbi:MAG: hypothetical protein H0W84_05250 [Bacteroidetes bacterium]|nr:hypothetical protein [Bacteroidota bacterium]